ncbi:hypothetical protein SAMN05216464_107285 [Mucilaginibacter pineti]|uniref:Uncharacterized protein n=1 Tax=Mucilaginibacter pineti TaxID=1391627 RepID=A0A1G7E5V6_9SPHI|nr:hypothetical protein SAMN05216464_107285 [Mucilaginibacter pineti]
MKVRTFAARLYLEISLLREIVAGFFISVNVLLTKSIVALANSKDTKCDSKNPVIT